MESSRIVAAGKWVYGGGMKRRLPMPVLAAALLLFGLVYEAGHLHHHWEHAHHHHDATHDVHDDCLVFHSGVIVEDTVVLAHRMAAASLDTSNPIQRPTTSSDCVLPEPRAPPIAS